MLLFDFGSKNKPSSSLGKSMRADAYLMNGIRTNSSAPVLAEPDPEHCLQSNGSDARDVFVAIDSSARLDWQGMRLIRCSRRWLCFVQDVDVSSSELLSLGRSRAKRRGLRNATAMPSGL
jgi:hypothetical protein